VNANEKCVAPVPRNAKAASRQYSGFMDRMDQGIQDQTPAAEVARLRIRHLRELETISLVSAVHLEVWPAIVCDAEVKPYMVCAMWSLPARECRS